MKRSTSIVALCAAVVLGLVLAPTGVAISQEVQRVFITNFPDVLKVSGTVGISGPVSHGRLVVLRDVVVSPVSPKDTARMVQGPMVFSDGFTGMVLGLSGQVKGEIYRSGTVGVILLPDDETVVRAFEEKGLVQFPVEISVSGVSTISSYFASNQSQATVAFPRYRSYFYNTSDKTVTVNLYAYLTN
ncbi:MAG TPA: hypothetical protein VFB67_10135 [Candidatus Polarisedimenticolaceae bacterium]|nr:hypothetical protein [Candidatus Polarisedimenticolaceae bacterium]